MGLLEVANSTSRSEVRRLEITTISPGDDSYHTVGINSTKSSTAYDARSALSLSSGFLLDANTPIEQYAIFWYSLVDYSLNG